MLTVNVSVLGTAGALDLRTLIVGFPLWLAVCHLYIALLREKRRMVLSTGHQVNLGRPPEDVPALDKLVFDEKEHAYSAYPSRG